jgi:hypothetical protein
VVNFGTHAGLGLPYILDRAGSILRSGDVVLLAPEYELLQRGGEPNEHTLQFVTFYDRGYLRQRSMTEWPHYIFGYGVLPSLVEGLKQLRAGASHGRADIVLDRLGNARGNTVALSKGRQLAGESPVLPPLPMSRAANEALRRFADIAARRHVRILVIPPSLIRTPGYSDPIYGKFLSGLAKTYSRLGLVMLGDPSQTFLPPGDMYDSVYHANDHGRIRYTNAILSFICPALACPK